MAGDHRRRIGIRLDAEGIAEDLERPVRRDDRLLRTEVTVRRRNEVKAASGRAVKHGQWQRKRR